MSMRIDLNCDLGEGGGHDAELLDLATSANIACGLHAGDPHTMRRTLELAVAKGVGLGAHPGPADRAGLGRGDADLSPEQAFDLVVYQIGALAAFATAAGTRLDHVKPHGALYNLAAADPAVARAVARAVRAADPTLILFGLAGSELARAGREAGLAVAEEAFADRAYRRDGTLVPRSQPGAMIDDPLRAAERAVRLVAQGCLVAIDGTPLSVRADTLCVHGDGPTAVPMARRLREALAAAGIDVRRIRRP